MALKGKKVIRLGEIPCDDALRHLDTKFIVRRLKGQTTPYEARLCEGKGGRSAGTIEMGVLGAFEMPSVSAAGPTSSLAAWNLGRNIARDLPLSLLERMGRVMVSLGKGRPFVEPERYGSRTYSEAGIWVDKQVAQLDDGLVTILQCTIGGEAVTDAPVVELEGGLVTMHHPGIGDQVETGLPGARMFASGNGASLEADSDPKPEAVVRMFELARLVSGFVLLPPSPAG